MCRQASKVDSGRRGRVEFPQPPSVPRPGRAWFKRGQLARSAGARPCAPPELRWPSWPLGTRVPGIEISEHLPRLARLADRFALVRSLHHNRGEHSGGTHRFLTGYPSVAANLNDAEYPDIGSVVARELEGQGGEVPVYVGNTKFYGGGPGYLGPGYAPFMPSPNPLSSTGNNTYDPVPLYLTAASQANLALSPDGALTLRRRHALLRTLDALPRQLDRPEALAAFDVFQQRAVELLAGRPGRDHWPKAMSVLLAGGGLRMGQVIGATNPRGEEPSRRAMDSNCLLATIYYRFGIDVHHLFHDRTGRPIPILPHGEIIPEL